ncbi:helix-turn-helix domain-containing protein [Parachryseolinea silvisoli]|uniref:helix-turn-helix domain-containing protein n=1 Tax=Parachryseolinea silvisoli TaxID=2873601 RepID=UPI002265C753|nr:helix-turn-helix transcriptional regulator [Parachryseolinea silvisoli]MCD9015248.1 helix-turn-helix transcriptional regulator [Parachryseolinea silvisoli]
MKNKEFAVAFGRNIKKLREERGWAQEDLAAAANIETTQVSRVENAKQSPTLDTILDLSTALGKYPHESLNVGVRLQLNNDFQSRKKKAKPKTKELILKLMDTDFFLSPRSVGETVKYCGKQFHIKLLNPAVSAILKELVDKKKLARTQDGTSRSFLYKKKAK